MTLFKIVNLNKYYQEMTKSFKALKDVNLSFEER